VCSGVGLSKTRAYSADCSRAGHLCGPARSCVIVDTRSHVAAHRFRGKCVRSIGRHGRHPINAHWTAVMKGIETANPDIFGRVIDHPGSLGVLSGSPRSPRALTRASSRYRNGTKPDPLRPTDRAGAPRASAQRNCWPVVEVHGCSPQHSDDGPNRNSYRRSCKVRRPVAKHRARPCLGEGAGRPHRRAARLPATRGG